MGGLRTFVSDGTQKVSYKTLLDDLNCVASCPKYLKPTSLYECFKGILASALSETEIVLLDSDFSATEIESLTGLPNGDLSKIQSPRTYKNLQSEDELVSLLASVRDFKITFFTSGTTGLPKKVSHTLASITRFLKQSPTHSNDVWGFAYNPTHIAGIQVFFQAIFNRNKIVRLFGLSADEVFSAIKSEEITHISATPTFYRMLIGALGTAESVKRITSGGERFDDTLLARITKIFPNAKITNVYASTEAGTLFASQGTAFVLKEDLKNLVRVDEGELLLDSSLLGDLQAIALDGNWYHTGDIVEVVCENPLTLKFVSRKNEMINIGGYKVNPSEVEDAILSIESVSQVRVYGKKNSVLGNIVCADVVSDVHDEKSVRVHLKTRLQEFKIPRIIKFVEKIESTRTGKTLRR